LLRRAACLRAEAGGYCAQKGRIATHFTVKSPSLTVKVGAKSQIAMGQH
jgi:hypothetical protein